jgi:hypothetical protein
MRITVDDPYYRKRSRSCFVRRDPPFPLSDEEGTGKALAAPGVGLFGERSSGMIKPMEVHLAAETEKKLKELSALSGRATDELVEDAMAGYFAEVQQIRETLHGRYDDLKSGKVKPIPGEKVEAHFREKSAAARSKSGS